MASTYVETLEFAFTRPVRYRMGEGVNVWAAKVNECAAMLDALDLPPDVEMALRDLFDELGQFTRDCFELANPGGSSLGVRLAKDA